MAENMPVDLLANLQRSIDAAKASSRPTPDLDTAAIRARLDASLARDLWHPALDDVKALLAENGRLTAALERVRALHPRRTDPRRGCCAAPKVCDGHPDECAGLEHGLVKPKWPCATVAALDGAHPTPSDGSGQ